MRRERFGKTGGSTKNGEQVGYVVRADCKGIRGAMAGLRLDDRGWMARARASPKCIVHIFLP